MTGRHLDLAALERFVDAEMAGREMVEASRHLLLCPLCRARLRRDVPGGDELLVRLRNVPAEPASVYEGIFERVESSALDHLRRLERERAAAPDLLAELNAVPPELRIAAAVADRRFHNTPLVVLLLDLCRSRWGEDPAAAEQTAALAVAVAGELLPAGAAGGRGVARDLEARAWAFLANVRRVRGDFRAAEAAFDQAEALLAQGSGDPLERARLLDLRASLLRFQRRFEPALQALAQAARIYRRLGERHLEGRAQLSRALVHGCAGEPEKGIPLLAAAIDQIDPREEPNLLLAALNNLLVDLTDLDRLAEAEALLPRLRQAAAELGTRHDRIRCRWAEAGLAAARGRLTEAEAGLRQVREELLAQGLGYEPALVSLELARIYLLAGRREEVRELAASLLTVFAARDIHREALAALQVFVQAVAQESATVKLVEEVAATLRRGRGAPACFNPPA
jgi:tetratricopeptide (TPR) repeat protein